MSFNVLVVGLVMEYLYPSCNQVLRIIEILAGYTKRLESWFKFIPLCHGSTTVLVVGHFSQLGYQNCKILADYCRNLSEAHNNGFVGPATEIVAQGLPHFIYFT